MALLLQSATALTVDAADRTLREGIYGSQVVLLLALGGRLLVPGPLPGRLATSVGVGLLLGWLWITREEGILLVPGLLLLHLGVLLVESRRSRLPSAADFL